MLDFTLKMMHAEIKTTALNCFILKTTSLNVLFYSCIKVLGVFKKLDQQLKNTFKCFVSVNKKMYI